MLTIQEKLDKAEEYKGTGNSFFKEGNFSRAKANYGKCLAYCTGLSGSSRNKTGYEGLGFQQSDPTAVKVTPEEDAAAVKLEQVCHQNLATCLLKLSAPSEALLHCHKALKLDREGTAWKARLRMGEAYLQLGRHDEAKEVFQGLLDNTEDEAVVAAVKKQMVRVNKLLKAHSAKEKQRYKNMFATEPQAPPADDISSGDRCGGDGSPTAQQE